MVTNIAGGEISGWAAVLARDEMFKKYKEEQRRQESFRTEGAGLFDQAVGHAGAEEAGRQLDKSAGERRATFDQVGQTPLGLPNRTQQSFSPSADKAYLKLRGGQRAKLGSYGDWGLDQALNQAMSQERINRLSDKAGGVASLFPYRMYQAEHSQDLLAQIGAAISSIGGGAANYGQYAKGPDTSGTKYQPYSGYQDAYGNQWNQGWNLYGGGAEGTIIPG